MATRSMSWALSLKRSTPAARRNHVRAYLFLAPTLIVLGLVFLYPLVQLIPMSFQRIAIGRTTWVGLANFKYLLTGDPLVRQAVLNNFKLLVGVPVLTVTALFLAVLLYERVRGSNIYQALLLLPYLLSIPVAGLVMKVLLRPDGAFNALLSAVGLGSLIRPWLGSAQLAIWTLLAVIIWRELGLGVALFLAEMMSLDEEIFDAAKVDGVNWFQKTVHILVPQLSTVIGFYIILEMITLFSWTFAYVFVMTNGGPGFSTMVTEFAIYRFAVEKNMPHMAAALSLLLFSFILLLIWIQFRLRGQLMGED